MCIHKHHTPSSHLTNQPIRLPTNSRSARTKQKPKREQKKTRSRATDHPSSLEKTDQLRQIRHSRRPSLRRFGQGADACHQEQTEGRVSLLPISVPSNLNSIKLSIEEKTEKITKLTFRPKQNRYGALSSTLQTSNNGNTNTNTNTTPQPRTPKRKTAAAAPSTAAPPASRKRARKVVAETASDDVEGESENRHAEDEHGDQEDAVPAPSAAKKARAKVRAGTAPDTAAAAAAAAAPAVGGVRVKSEFGREGGVGEEVLAEEEVSIF
jgi:hypothetical protein